MSSKHFCLKWTKFQTNILSAFESLQNTEDLADVTLTCEGINIKAHKFILSACSPYFRTIFKENPCPHPIVILKDVAYIDLIAIVNFMYHGEVLVAEEHLHSFLQTATILQVSGLINNESPCRINTNSTPKKTKPKPTESLECPIKKVKVSSKPKKPTVEEENLQNQISPSQFEVLEIDKIKTENDGAEKRDDKEINASNIDKSNETGEKTEIQGSILEAALEVKDKPSSILERSLTSQPVSGIQPSSINFPPDKLNLLQVLPDISIPKTIFIPRKPPESEIDKLIMRSSSESSSSPLTFDRPTEFLQQSIKIEGEHYESDVISPDETGGGNFQRSSMEVPHHSSQCGNCPHCGKIYSNQSALKYHVRLVHSDLTNMYCCHLCPESFDYREGYKKHMAEVHSIRN